MYTFMNIAKNPFKTYVKGVSIGFGITLVGNFIWTSLDNKAPLSVRENPETYTTLLLLKSIHSGVLWPAIPFRILYSPKRFFCLGSGVYDVYDAYNDNNLSDVDKYFEDNHTNCTMIYTRILFSISTFYFLITILVSLCRLF